MIDIHTHILPGMDDGSKDAEMSLAMLQMERDQGIDAVVLTPHFYRDRERIEHFLDRRQAAMERLNARLMELPEEERAALPRLTLGAEVAWRPNLEDWPELDRMCMGRSKYLLLELPFSPWNGQMIDQIYNLMGRTGITPIIAHIERYIKDQRKDLVAEVLALDVPVQVSSAPLLRPFARGQILKLLQEGKAQFLASDCHNITTRQPNLGPGLKVARSKLGEGKIQAMERHAADLFSVHESL